MERWRGSVLLIELGQAERAVGVLLFIFFDGVDVGGFGALGPAHVGYHWWKICVALFSVSKIVVEANPDHELSFPRRVALNA